MTWTHRLSSLVVLSIVLLAGPLPGWPHGGALDAYGYRHYHPAGEPVLPEGRITVLGVVQERVHKQGVFLVVDALVENVSRRRVDGAQVTVEFYNFFDKLVSFEYAVLLPPTLGPGHKGALRVITPFSDAMRKIRYRFTWWRDGTQFQNVVEGRIPALVQIRVREF